MNETTTRGDGVIDLAVPLTTEFASIVRVLVASLAADHGFSIDEIDDLRLGVSEVFTILADDAPDGARCIVRTELDDSTLSIVMSRGAVDDVVVLDGLASTILSSVVDEHRVVDGGVVMKKRALEALAD